MSTLLLALLACTSKDDVDTSEPADTDTDTDTDTDSDADTDTDTDTDIPCAAPSFAGPAPVAWYGLDDAGSATVADGAGTYDATSSGRVVADAGKVGTAARFDGASGYVSATPPMSAGAFTWAGWVRLDALPGDFGILANHGNGPTGYSGWLFVVPTSGVPTLYTEAGTGETELATVAVDPLTIGAWTHLAATFDAGRVHLYVNGASVASQDVGYAAVVPSDNPFVMGRDANNGGRYLSGALDEVGYWNVALAAGDIAALVVDGECGVSSI